MAIQVGSINAGPGVTTVHDATISPETGARIAAGTSASTPAIPTPQLTSGLDALIAANTSFGGGTTPAYPTTFGAATALGGGATTFTVNGAPFGVAVLGGGANQQFSVNGAGLGAAVFGGGGTMFSASGAPFGGGAVLGGGGAAPFTMTGGFGSSAVLGGASAVPFSVIDPSMLMVGGSIAAAGLGTQYLVNPVTGQITPVNIGGLPNSGVTPANGSTPGGTPAPATPNPGAQPSAPTPAPEAPAATGGGEAPKPPAAPASTDATDADKKAKEKKEADAAAAKKKAEEEAATKKAAEARKPATYTVRPGDTLSAIASTHNSTVAKLAKINSIANPNVIHPGQVIKFA